MSCEILWSPKTINRRFNHFYPFLISTPNGQTIESIRLVNMEKDEDTGALVEIAHDRVDQPSLIVPRINDSMNIKKYELKPNETKYYSPIYGSINSGRSTSLVSPDNINQPIKINKLIHDLDCDQSGRLFSSFLLMTARVQAPAAQWLYEARVEITMSDNTLMVQTLKYISPMKKIQDQHKAALYKSLYIFYHNIVGTDYTDDEVIANITGKIQEVWPDMTMSTEYSKRKSASNGTKRRAVLNAKRKRRPKKPTVYNEKEAMESSDEESDSDEGGELLEPPVKRQVTHVNAILMSRIEWMDVDKGIFYIIMKDHDVSGDEWVIDNVETSPVLDGRVEVLKEPPTDFTNNPDMYKSIPYRTIIENARNHAKESGDTLLWLKISDSGDFIGPTSPTTVRFTARNTTNEDYVNAVTNGFEGSGLDLFTEKVIIKTLHDYSNGSTTPYILMDPPTVEGDNANDDFTHFQKPGEIDLGDLEDDGDDGEVPITDMADSDFLFDDLDALKMDDLDDAPLAPATQNVPSPEPLSPTAQNVPSPDPPMVPFSPLPLSPIDLEPIDDDL